MSAGDVLLTTKNSPGNLKKGSEALTLAEKKGSPLAWGGSYAYSKLERGHQRHRLPELKKGFPRLPEEKSSQGSGNGHKKAGGGEQKVYLRLRKKTAC